MRTATDALNQGLRDTDPAIQHTANDIYYKMAAVLYSYQSGDLDDNERRGLDLISAGVLMDFRNLIDGGQDN